jgi:hypothetical protein
MCVIITKVSSRAAKNIPATLEKLPRVPFECSLAVWHFPLYRPMAIIRLAQEDLSVFFAFFPLASLCSKRNRTFGNMNVVMTIWPMQEITSLLVASPFFACFQFPNYLSDLRREINAIWV